MEGSGGHASGEAVSPEAVERLVETAPRMERVEHFARKHSTNSWRRARALVRILKARVLALGEAVQEDGALQAQFHDGAVNAAFAEAGGIVGLFDIVETAFELDAFLVVGLLDRGR